MEFFCRNCNRHEEADIKTINEAYVLNGVEFHADQRHVYCSCCGSELFPDKIMDSNVRIAHEAYRKAIGAITVAEIQMLLKKYDIGANPLSKLLGWGENSIERQMKHTVPDKEHSEQLRRLFNPLNMCDLLLKNGDELTKTAFVKAAKATLACILSLVSVRVMNTSGNKQNYSSDTTQCSVSAIDSAVDSRNEQKYTISRAECYGGNFCGSAFSQLTAA